MVYDNLVFCFVEIKDTDNQKLNSRTKNLAKAYLQLETTIQIFFSALNFTGYLLEAIVAFRDKPTIPVASATNLYQRFRFMSTYNTHLQTGNEKTF